MLISVVIPCHNGVRDTRGCLASLQEQVLGTDCALEIVVVDNGSADETGLLDREFPGVHLLRLDHNHGFAGGVNRGLAVARGDYLVVLNNDTLAAPHLLERLLQPLVADDNIGISAPVSNHVKGTARLAMDAGVGSDRKSRRDLEQTLQEFAGHKLQDTDTLAGLCMMFRRSTAQRLGNFDEQFGRGNFEDDDLCLRARLLGYRLVIVRDAFLFHHGHRTFDALGVDYRAEMQERETTFRLKWRHDPAGQVVDALLDQDLERAASLTPAALRAHPSWPDGHLVMARWHAREENHPQAIHSLETFLAACPLHTEARVMLAFQLLVSGDEAAGTDCLSRSLQECYFSERALADMLSLRARWALQRNRPEQAQQDLEAALELQPDDLGILNLMGVCLWNQGQRQRGLTTMVRCLEQQPDDPTAGENLQKALGQLAGAGVGVRGLQHRLASLLDADQSGKPNQPG